MSTLLVCNRIRFTVADPYDVVAVAQVSERGDMFTSGVVLQMTEASPCREDDVVITLAGLESDV